MARRPPRRRFKKEIKADGSSQRDALLSLKPVTFHYKSDTKGISQFGLIAEDVAEVNPNLVVREAKGEIYSVRYEAVNAMLLNEFLKEHRKGEEQQATITQQRKDFEAALAFSIICRHASTQPSRYDLRSYYSCRHVRDGEVGLQFVKR